MRNHPALFTWLILSVVACTFPLSAAPLPAFREQVSTPHWNWVDRHAGGTVKALFITSFLGTREPEELAQRFDIEVDTVPVTANPSGIPESYDEAYLTDALGQKPDIIFVAYRGAWSKLSEDALNALVTAVADGIPLIALSPAGTPSELRNNPDKQLAVEALAAMERDVPFTRLQFPWARENGRINLGINRHGKGRFINVAMGHGAGGGFNAFVPGTADSLVSPAEYEIAYAMFARLIRWAAGKTDDPGCSLKNAATANHLVGVAAHFEMTPPLPDGIKAAIEWELRSPFGDLLGKSVQDLPGQITVPLPQAGELTLLYRLRRNGAVAAYGAVPVQIQSGLAITALKLPESIQATAPVQVVWTVEPAMAAPAEFLLQVYDPDGRLVSWKRVPGSVRQCQLDGWQPRNYTRFTLRLLARTEDSTVLDEERQPLNVLIDRSEDPSRFHVMTWATERGDIQEQWRYQRLRQFGITAFSPVGTRMQVAEMAAAAGLRLAPVNVCVPPNRFKKEFSPAKERETLEAYSKAIAPLSPLGYSLADEPAGVDLAGFRNWAADIIRKHDPGARVGYCGTHMKTGMDIPGIMASCDFMIHYSPHYLYTSDLWRGIERDLHRSFSDRTAINSCYTHYIPWRDHEPYSRTVPWLLLFEEANGISYFASAGGNFAILPGDLRSTHETRWWSEEVLELQKGVATQLIAMERDSGGIAILLPTEIPEAFREITPRAVNIWVRAMRELNLSYRLVARDALSKLNHQATPLLICPAAPVLTRDELAAIERYVANGGTLVATAPFALSDPDGRKLEASGFWEARPEDPKPIDKKSAEPAGRPLDIESLCGVRRGLLSTLRGDALFKEISTGSGIPCMVSWNSHANGPAVELEAYTGGQYELIPNGAEILSTFSGDHDDAPEFARRALSAPAALRHRLGDGVVYYLNFTPKAAAAQWLAMDLASETGAAPPPAVVTIDGKPASATYLYPFQGSDVRAIGVIQDYERVKPVFENLDKETALYYHHGPYRWAAQDAQMTLSAPVHVYDMRRQRYLGYTDQAPFSLRPGEPQLFALLPYRINHVEVDMPEAVTAGNSLSLRTRVVADNGTPGDHVVRVCLWANETPERISYSDTVMLTRGEGDITVPTAFNDEPGAWTLEVTDVPSGVKIRRNFPLVAPQEDTGPPLAAGNVTVTRRPLEYKPGEWAAYTDPDDENLKAVQVSVGKISRQRINYGPYNGKWCLTTKTLLGLRGRKAHYCTTYFAYNDWEDANWEDQRRVKAQCLSGLGINRPAGHLWYYNGYIDIHFDDERVTGYRIADVCKVDVGKDGRVDVAWESPAGEAVLSFGMTLDGDALLQQLQVRTAVPVEVVKVRFRSYIGGFGKSKTRYVQTPEGKNVRATDPKVAPWAFYADDVNDLAYGKGMGAGGILILPEEWNRVQYGIDTVLEKKVDLQPGQTKSFHWALWLYADLTNEEAFEAFTASRAREAESLKSFFAEKNPAP